MTTSTSLILDSDFAQALAVLNENEDELHPSWIVLQNKPHMRIWKQQVEGTKLYRYRMHGVLDDNVDLALIHQMNNDTEYRKSWDDFVIDLDTLEELPNGGCVLYWSAKFLPPLSNRDYVLARQGRHFPEQDCYITLSKGCEHPTRPVRKHFIRVDTYTSSLLYRKRADGKLDFYLLYFDDLKGKVPKNLVNFAIQTGVPKYLKTMLKAYHGYHKWLESKGGAAGCLRRIMSAPATTQTDHSPSPTMTHAASPMV